MLKKYTFTKIKRAEYPLIDEILYVIKSSFENLKEKKYGFVTNDYLNGRVLCERLKVEAIEKSDEYSANLSFLLKQYLDLINSVSDFWRLCEKADFQEAWDFLQDALDLARVISKFSDCGDQSSMDLIISYLAQTEKLYPYVLFCSTELVVKKTTCSICNNSPFDPECNHISGDLYWGEIALNIIDEMMPVMVVLLKDPFDKRCIIPIDFDKNNVETSPFKLIHSFIQQSKKPFLNYDLLETNRKLPRKYYDKLSEESLCPCGSEKKFKACCFNKKYILVPIYEVTLKESIKLKL